MVKKCIYCSAEINIDSVVDVCTPCGHGVWGEQMFQAIIDNMNSAKEKGDLYQGSVSDNTVEPQELRVPEEKFNSA